MANVAPGRLQARPDMRKRYEEFFGLTKAPADLRNARHRGIDRVIWQFTLTLAAYNLMRPRRQLACAG